MLKRHRGAVLIDFSIGFIYFFMFLSFLLEVCLMFYSSGVVDYALNDISKEVRLGNVPTTNWDGPFQILVSDINVRYYSDLQSINSDFATTVDAANFAKVQIDVIKSIGGFFTPELVIQRTEIVPLEAAYGNG